jgi:hypothetical protein
MRPQSHFHNSKHASATRHRRGAVLVAALVCLTIVMAIVGGMLKATLAMRRQLRVERDVRQTELLLEAGAARAAFRLAGEADYDGETWELPAEAIIGHGSGRVTIVASREADTAPWQLKITAEYPLAGESSIRRSRTFFVQPQMTQIQE